MPKPLFDDGIFIVTIKHVIQKSGGALMYQRRVPADLKSLEGKVFSRRAIKNGSPAQIAKQVAAFVREDDARWAAMRAYPSTSDHVTALVDARLDKWRKEPREHGEDEAPPTDAENLGEMLDDYLLDQYGDTYYDLKMGNGYNGARGIIALKARLSPVDFETYRRVMAMRSGTQAQPVLSVVLEEYLKAKGEAFQRKGAAAVRLALSFVLKTVGDRPLGDYTRDHARQVRDALLQQNLRTTSVRRRLNDIRAVFNHGLREHDLGSLGNKFEHLTIPNEKEDASARLPFTVAELDAIARACRSNPESDASHIIGMMLETGARLAEIVGLRTEDVTLDADIPYVWIRPHKALGRTLKSLSSKRRLPLVGIALWAAQAAPKGNLWLFPRYAEDHNIKAGSASARLNPWLKSVTGTEKTSHCFRHAMKDRLRTAEVPEDIQLAITGHGKTDVSRQYGEGYPLDVLQKHLDALKRLS